MEAHEIPLPIVHLNGTGRESLKRDYDLLHEKLEEFMEVWRKTEFHARDYYPGGDTYYASALAVRQGLHRGLIDIETYIDAHRAHLHNNKA